MHNVRPGSCRLWRQELDLSNTSVSKKTLSSSKPPHDRSSFAAFRHVLDGVEAPGKGNEEPFRVPFTTRSALFRAVPSKEACTGPNEARFLSNPAVKQGLLPCPGGPGGPPSLPGGPGGPMLSALVPCNASWALKAQEAQLPNREGMKPTIPLREKSRQNAI